MLTELGVPHGFTTRVGGISQGVFSTLNFGNPMDLPPSERDPGENIAQNFRRVLEELGVASRVVAQVHQVHGGRAVEASEGEAKPDTRADAIVTADPAIMAAVRVADCAPVLLACESGKLVAAVHAGWRGVIAGVLPAAMDLLRSRGAARVVACVGPCLSVGNFEVGEEVVRAFRDCFGPGTPHVRTGAREGKWMLDIKQALGEQARTAGAAAVEVLQHCTYADEASFFSHRRDRGVTGRMVGLIGVRP